MTFTESEGSIFSGLVEASGFVGETWTPGGYGWPGGGCGPGGLGGYSWPGGGCGPGGLGGYGWPGGGCGPAGLGGYGWPGGYGPEGCGWRG